MIYAILMNILYACNKITKINASYSLNLKAIRVQQNKNNKIINSISVK